MSLVGFTVLFYFYAFVHPVDGAGGITFSVCPYICACVRACVVEVFSAGLLSVSIVLYSFNNF